MSTFLCSKNKIITNTQGVSLHSRRVLTFGRRSGHFLRMISYVGTFAAMLLVFHAALAQDATSNPWHASQVEQPAALARKLAAKTGAKPVLIQVGFSVLYRSKHIPGSIYAGPASTPEGLAMLKKAVAKLPKKSDIYLYCGCCPINKCPNIRPAFAALTSMGFTRLHVVMLSTSFGKNWVAPGYPVAGETASAK